MMLYRINYQAIDCYSYFRNRSILPINFRIILSLPQVSVIGWRKSRPGMMEGLAGLETVS